MIKINFKKKFEEFCKSKKFERNEKQIEIINLLEKFLNNKTKSLFFIKNKNFKSCFYLNGNVGVGKTMILNFAFDLIKVNKMKSHFNEFMIKFHDFRHEKKDDKSITLPAIFQVKHPLYPAIEPDDADHSFGFDFTIIIGNNVKMFGYYEQITFVIDYLCVMKIHDLHAY